MNEILPVSALGLESAAPLLDRLGIGTAAKAPAAGSDFSSILKSGLEHMNEKIATADDLVRQFALDDNVPLHQVTIALEEARLSVELGMQVRQRLVESYRDLMNMQL